MLCLLSARAQGVVFPFYLWPLPNPFSLHCVMASPPNEVKMYSLLVFSSQMPCLQFFFTSQDGRVPIQEVTEKVSPEVPDVEAVSALMGPMAFLSVTLRTVHTWRDTLEAPDPICPHRLEA